ncbi:MrpH family fimbial adhesin [Yersinia intermedia]|uniref:MrpH family fimbial adhesin n=1 Tax=Yersinia intermedia TaxID=631 RepID=UPI004054E359
MKLSKFCLIIIAILYSATASPIYIVNAFEISGNDISWSGVWPSTPGGVVPCTGNGDPWYPRSCVLYLSLVISPPPAWLNGFPLPIKPGGTATTDAQKTWENLNTQISGEYRTRSIYPIPPDSDLCLQVHVITIQSHGNSQGTHSTLASSPLPGETCTPVKATASCKVSASLTIDHGTVSVARVDGHSASSPLTFNCTAPASVWIRPMMPITMSGNITSTLFVGDIPIMAGPGARPRLQLGKGTTTVDIESRLYAPGNTSPGISTGSGVLIISYE